MPERKCPVCKRIFEEGDKFCQGCAWVLESAQVLGKLTQEEIATHNDRLEAASRLWQRLMTAERLLKESKTSIGTASDLLRMAVAEEEWQTAIWLATKRLVGNPDDPEARTALDLAEKNANASRLEVSPEYAAAQERGDCHRMWAMIKRLPLVEKFELFGHSVPPLRHFSTNALKRGVVYTILVNGRVRFRDWPLGPNDEGGTHLGHEDYLYLRIDNEKHQPVLMKDAENWRFGYVWVGQGESVELKVKSPIFYALDDEEIYDAFHGEIREGLP